MTEKIIYPIIPASCVRLPNNTDLASAIGVAGGLAPLDSNGKIPSANLPSKAVVNITDTAATIAVQPNTIYMCANPLSSLTITSIPDSTEESTIVFYPNYGSQAQQDALCPITLPSRKTLINFSNEDYKYNQKAVICIKFGMMVFGQ